MNAKDITVMTDCPVATDSLIFVYGKVAEEQWIRNFLNYRIQKKEFQIYNTFHLAQLYYTVYIGIIVRYRTMLKTERIFSVPVMLFTYF
jgi:hypothetical protein